MAARAAASAPPPHFKLLLGEGRASRARRGRLAAVEVAVASIAGRRRPAVPVAAATPVPRRGPPARVETRRAPVAARRAAPVAVRSAVPAATPIPAPTAPTATTPARSPAAAAATTTAPVRLFALLAGRISVLPLALLRVLRIRRRCVSGRRLPSRLRGVSRARARLLLPMHRPRPCGALRRASVALRPDRPVDVPTGRAEPVAVDASDWDLRVVPCERGGSVRATTRRLRRGWVGGGGALWISCACSMVSSGFPGVSTAGEGWTTPPATGGEPEGFAGEVPDALRWLMCFRMTSRNVLPPQWSCDNSATTGSLREAWRTDSG